MGKLDIYHNHPPTVGALTLWDRDLPGSHDGVVQKGQARDFRPAPGTRDLPARGATRRSGEARARLEMCR
ncbi:Hypothetical protein A7982_01643 [Minicystis rosea]|nr:Hypothetical protein A7982_01643 [Minicystis rosea]